MKCFSYFGCHFAQERQPRFCHLDGMEIFIHNVHGYFTDIIDDDEELFRNLWPAKLWDKIRHSPFRIDKRRVRDDAMRQIKRYGGHRCPAFSAQFLDAQIEKLPDIVDRKPTPCGGSWR